MSRIIAALQKILKVELLIVVATVLVILTLAHLHAHWTDESDDSSIEAPPPPAQEEVAGGVTAAEPPPPVAGSDQREAPPAGGVIGGAEPATDHCGCEGACEKCHHLCLECKCGSHIIDRGVKCQEFAACEAGCSGISSRASDAQTEQPVPPGLEGGPKPCKHCHKVCDDKHGGDANPECQACILEHCILVGSDGSDGGEACADLDDLAARLNELDCGQDQTTQFALQRLDGVLGCG